MLPICIWTSVKKSRKLVGSFAHQDHGTLGISAYGEMNAESLDGGWEARHRSREWKVSVANQRTTINMCIYARADAVKVVLIVLAEHVNLQPNLPRV